MQRCCLCWPCWQCMMCHSVNNPYTICLSSWFDRKCNSQNIYLLIDSTMLTKEHQYCQNASHQSLSLNSAPPITQNVCKLLSTHNSYRNHPPWQERAHHLYNPHPFDHSVACKISIEIRTSQSEGQQVRRLFQPPPVLYHIFIIFVIFQHRDAPFFSQKARVVAS